MNIWMEDIKEVVIKYKPKRIVEIGSADGSISTSAILAGIRIADFTPDFLFCFEYKKELYESLKKLEVSDWFKPLMSTSSKINDWMTLFDVNQFYKDYRVKNTPPINSVFNWYLESVSYLINNPELHENGIRELIINKFGDSFDMVLIDGGPFSGECEYELLKNSKIIILDDIHDIKCHKIFLKLLNDENYTVYKQNDDFCNGYCIFIRK
jgi:hypothetical protein